jgi:hypothetical protein
MIMRTFALLLIMVAIAASQPHHWLSEIMAAIARCIGK